MAQFGKRITKRKDGTPYKMGCFAIYRVIKARLFLIRSALPGQPCAARCCLQGGAAFSSHKRSFWVCGYSGMSVVCSAALSTSWAVIFVKKLHSDKKVFLLHLQVLIFFQHKKKPDTVPLPIINPAFSIPKAKPPAPANSSIIAIKIPPKSKFLNPFAIPLVF